VFIAEINCTAVKRVNVLGVERWSAILWSILKGLRKPRAEGVHEGVHDATQIEVI
jgi:hypothetical protein